MVLCYARDRADAVHVSVGRNPSRCALRDPFPGAISGQRRAGIAREEGCDPLVNRGIVSGMNKGWVSTSAFVPEKARAPAENAACLAFP
jgi:hypothetical protein